MRKQKGKAQLGRRYVLLRRAVLSLAVTFVVVVPVLHLAALNAGTGLRWAGVVRWLGVTAEPPVMGAPWSVRLFGLELLDPLALLGLLSARRVDLWILAGAVPTVLLVVVFGRFFCGWLCPYLPVLAAANAARALLVRLGFSPRNTAFPKWTSFLVLLAALVATAISGSQLAPLVYPPAIIGREVFRAIFFGSLSTGALVIAAAFFLDTFVSKAGFCQYLCPGGATFRLLSLRSPIHVERTIPLCTDCGLCDQVCNLGQSPMTDKLDSGCERCGKCVAVCPTDALQLRAKLGHRALVVLDQERKAAT